MLNTNQPAPLFTLPNQDNKLISLQEYVGSWVVVYFYPKDDTPGCTTEACNFRDGFAELTKQNVVVLGISKDSVVSHKKFHDKFKLNFDILADPDKTVIEAYGAWQEKSMYGKAFMGIQRMTYLIDPKGIIAEVWPKVTPKDHATHILGTIEKLTEHSDDVPA